MAAAAQLHQLTLLGLELEEMAAAAQHVIAQQYERYESRPDDMLRACSGLTILLSV